MDYEIELKNLRRQHTAVIRFRCAPGQAGALLGPAYGEIGGYLHDSGIDHDDAGVFARFLELGAEQHVEAGFTVKEPIAPKGRVKPGELPECEAATTVHVGPYDGLIGAMNAIRAWMRDNGREPGGAPWELYVSDPETTAPTELQTEVYYPLKPR